MKFIIDSNVFKKFPNLIIALPIVTGFDNSRSEKEALDFLRQTEAKLRTELTLEAFWKDPRVIAYLDCFTRYGSDPKKFVPAHIALAVRVLEGKNLPDINPMVNLYNAMSLKYLTPFGGENLDSLFGNFVLKFARGGEQWIPIGGDKSKPAVVGELVWGDDYNLSTRALNWRQCDRTKMTADTKNGYFVMDGFSGVNEDNIKKAAQEFTTLATKYFGGKAKIYWINKDNPSVEVPFSSREMKPGITNNKFKSRIVKAIPIPDRKEKGDLPLLFQSVSWEGKDTIGFKLKQIILRACQKIAGEKLDLKLEDVKIEHPKQENYGDYSTNIALINAGKVGMKPIEFARKLANALNKYIRQYQSIPSLSDSFVHQDSQKQSSITYKDPKTVGELLENVTVAGPGFVNLTIRSEYLISLLTKVLGKGNGSGTSFLGIISDNPPNLPLRGKKIMVEFAHPNTHKEFHIGHLRNISIGESIVRILEEVGAQLFRANYEGDVGLHVAKAIWGVREIIKKEKLQISALRELNPANKAKFLGEGYALGNKMSEENEAVKKEIINLNKSIYHDPKKIELWEETRRWSLEYFDTVYKRVGTHFDRLFFESEVEAKGREIVKDNIKTGIFIQDKDGSIYFPGEKYGLNNCVFVTGENYATYEGKEVALEELEFNTFHFDADIHVVAHEQQNFFQIAFKAVETLFPIQKGRQFHLAYGMVNLKSGKLSSRTGQVVTADWLIDQAKEKIKKIIQESAKTKDTSDGGEATTSTPPTVKETEDIAEKVAVAAVKYSMLKVNPKMDIAFDLAESVSLEGDSGPYLMYTYARCKSVMRKSGLEGSSLKLPKSLKLLKDIKSEELSLLRTLYRFPEVVIEAARTLSPHLLCGFLFDLAQKYNLFYNKHSILNPVSGKDTSDGGRQAHSARNDSSKVEESVKSFRISLTAATAQILHRGLHLLGIDTVERM